MSILEQMQVIAKTMSPKLFVLTPNDADALALETVPARLGISDVKMGDAEIVVADVEQSFYVTHDITITRIKL